MPRLTSAPGSHVEEELYRDRTQGLYKLAGMKLLGCGTIDQSWETYQMGFITATWSTNVSTFGWLVGVYGDAVGYWPVDYRVVPGTGGMGGR